MTCVSSVGIIKSKKTMMKKEYVKPEVAVEEILLESYMLGMSGSNVDPDAPGVEGDPEEASARRGAWGDFWN